MNGLTGQPVHAGSWFGLPDFGVTEAIGGLLGAPRTSQGGSNLSALLPGGQQSVPAQPRPNTQGVLGASTTTQGNLPSGSVAGPGLGGGSKVTSSTSQGSSQNAQPPSTAQPQAINNVSSDLLNQINGLYSGQMNYLNQLASNILPQSRDTNLASAQNYYNTQVGLLPGQQQQLMAPIQQNQQTFNQNQTSAAQQAQQAYDAMRQQAQSFGGSSSTSGALSDLAYQAFAQQQQGLQNANASGQLEFANEGNQVAQFVAQKHADLDNWLNEAKTMVQNNFQSQLAQVQQQEGLTQDAKQQAQLGILQNAVQQNNAIQVADQQFRQQLALFQATQGNQIANSSMDQSGFGTALQRLMMQTPQITPYTVNFGQSPDVTAMNTGITGALTGKPDYLSNPLQVPSAPAVPAGPTG